jgi:hypothetical protein
MWATLMCVVVVYIYIYKILATCRRIYSNVMGRRFENNEHVLPVCGFVYLYNTPTLARSQNPENSMVLQIIESVLKDGREQHRVQLAAHKELMDAMLAIQQKQMDAMLVVQREQMAVLIDVQ